jgi:isoleucyl-tRNA synthetase
VGVCDTYRKVRNTFRFFLANCEDFNSIEFRNLSVHSLVYCDLLAINYMFLFMNSCRLLYKKYEYSSVYQFLRHVCVNVLSSFYLDILKDRLYTCKRECLSRQSAQYALYIIFILLLHVISPILSYTAEELWVYVGKSRFERLGNCSSIFMSVWPDNFLKKHYTIEQRVSFFEDWNFLYRFRCFIFCFLDYFIRTKHFSTRSQVELVLFCNKLFYENLLRYKSEIYRLLGVARIFILQQVCISETTILVIPKRSGNMKCMRCWRFVISCILTDASINLCNRCRIIVSSESTVCTKFSYF